MQGPRPRFSKIYFTIICDTLIKLLHLLKMDSLGYKNKMLWGFGFVPNKTNHKHDKSVRFISSSARTIRVFPVFHFVMENLIALPVKMKLIVIVILRIFYQYGWKVIALSHAMTSNQQDWHCVQKSLTYVLKRGASHLLMYVMALPTVRMQLMNSVSKIK